MLKFDRLYWFYDPLAKLVYGQTLEKAKQAFLPSIPDGSKVLLIGGGTGATLEYMSKHCKNVEVDFVESSTGMINRARQRGVSNLKVDYHNVPIEGFEGGSYDAVITEFFFDMFEPAKTEEIFSVIISHLKRDGMWLDTDFRVTHHLIHKLLTQIMILFFRLTVGMEAKRLHNTMKLFEKGNLRVKKEISFNGGFVTSQLIGYD